MSVFSRLHPRIIRQFESNAREQTKFHLCMAYLWLLAMVVVVFIFPAHDPYSAGQLFIIEISLYNNFATEFGALAGSQASSKADEITGTTGAILPLRSDP